MATISYINYPIFLQPMSERYPIACEEGKRICLEQESVCVPRYATCHSSIDYTGKRGSGPGELDHPAGIAIHEDTHHIFAVNRFNNRVEIFSETGEFLYQLGVGQLHLPYCIATHGESVYVICWGDHTVSKFSLTEMRQVRKIGGCGSKNGRFYYPHQLSTDSIGRVFIADTYNHRICLCDPDLIHLRNITHQSISRPFDVKVSRDRLYVLCPDNDPCMLTLTLEGDMLHSLITRPEGMDVFSPFFCLDHLNNFVISHNHRGSDSICVYSPEGSHPYTLAGDKYQPGIFCYLRGLAMAPNGRLVCVSSNQD